MSAGVQHEIVVSRTVRAPRDLVLQMYREPEHLTRWWGPRGFSTTTHSMDFRVGGEWRFIMHATDGTAYPNVVRYTRLDPDMLEWAHFGEDLERPAFHSTVRLTDLGDRTQLTIRMVFDTDEGYQRALGMGAEAGLNGTLDRLEELLASQS